jgi:hypothetical protein
MTENRLSPNAAKPLIEALPSNIREALMAYAQEAEYPMTSGRS